MAAAALPASASAGRVLATPDLPIGTTIVHAFELPPLDDQLLSAPRLLIAAAGTGAGWRKAALLLSPDGGASWRSIGATAAPAVIGTLVTAPAATPPWLGDWKESFDIDLARPDMTLADADDAALDGGANLALVGNELVQFGRAEPLGGARWRLSRLWRGRRGTEAAIGTQGAGDRFVATAADRLVAVDLPATAIGTSVRVLASGVGDIDGPAVGDALVSGAFVAPPSPVHLTAHDTGSGDLALSWVRRSRAGWRWIDGVDAPLAEERERYRVTMTPEGGAARTIEVAEPSLVITAADRGAGSLSISVRQIGLVAESPATALAVAGLVEE